MSKLALLALVLGTGGCVADDAGPTVVATLVTPASNAAIEQDGILSQGPPASRTSPVNGQVYDRFEDRVIDGRVPGTSPLSDSVDFSNRTALDDARATALCKLAGNLPSEDVCSLLCNSAAFAERVFGDNGATSDCTYQLCQLAGSTYNVSVCH